MDNEKGCVVILILWIIMICSISTCVKVDQIADTMESRR